MRAPRWFALVALLWWLPLAVSIEAAGTVTQEHQALGNIRRIVFTCTADAADGSFPATAVSVKFEGRLVSLETNPGSTAPTDDYDIVLTDAHGLDVLRGAGGNRDTANTEIAAVVFSSTSAHPMVDETDTLTLAISNNSVNSATVVIVLTYALGG